MTTDTSTADDIAIPPEIESRHEGEWIAWDTRDQTVIGHDEDLAVVVRAAQTAFEAGHLIYYRHILAPGTTIVGGL